MKIVKMGSRRIKIFFNERKIDEYAKEKNKGYIHGFCDREKDEIYIRSKLPAVLKRICLWHELGHLSFDFLRNLSDETLVETNGRFIDEILDRNKWVRLLYKKEKK